MSIIIGLILAIAMQVSGTSAPAEDSASVATMLADSQAALHDECDCVTVPLVERYDTGLFVGAIAEDTEVSIGFWFADDGTITFERSEP